MKLRTSHQTMKWKVRVKALVPDAEDPPLKPSKPPPLGRLTACRRAPGLCSASTSRTSPSSRGALRFLGLGEIVDMMNDNTVSVCVCVLVLVCIYIRYCLIAYSCCFILFIYVRMYVCMYVCMYTHIHTYIRTYTTYTYIYIYIYVDRYMCVYPHMYIYIYIHTYILYLYIPVGFPRLSQRYLAWLGQKARRTQEHELIQSSWFTPRKQACHCRANLHPYWALALDSGLGREAYSLGPTEKATSPRSVALRHYVARMGQIG